SLVLRQLASYPRQNGSHLRCASWGDWNAPCSPSIGWGMRNCNVKPAGKTHNSLARAVFIHRLGEIRDRTYENQQYRASGLNILVTAIILWNTRYLERAIAALRQAEDVPDQLLAHLSPLGWEHVNLTGDYIWSAERPAT